MPNGTMGAYGRAVIPGMSGISTLSGLSRQMNEMARQDRQHEINMRELEYTAARRALGLDVPGRARGGSTQANAFLDRWQQELQGVRGMYNRALSGVEGTYDVLRRAETAAMGLGDLAGRVEQEYQGYLSEMTPLRQEMETLAGEEAGTRRALMAQIPALTQYDPEAAAGRAIADVAGQAGQARQAEARRLASMGIDPTSGRGAAIMRGLTGGEALGRAMGATAARQAERTRATQATMQGLSLIDPTRSAQAALDIRTGANQLLGMSAQLLGQQATALGGLASTRAGVGRTAADIATQYAQNIAQPFAEIGGLQAGLNYQQGGAVNFGNVLQSLQNRSPIGAFGASASYNPSTTAQAIGSPLAVKPTAGPHPSAIVMQGQGYGPSYYQA